AELVECHRHEELLNVAFEDAAGFWLVCPYDTEALDPEVVERAQTTHPLLREGVVSRESGRYDDEAPAAPSSDPLPEPSSVAEELPVAAGALARVRECVRRHAAAAGLSDRRRDDLV